MTDENWFEKDGRRVRQIGKLLLACPFCDSRNLLLTRTTHFAQGHPNNPNPWDYAMFCTSCGSQSGWQITETDAINRWNLRPPRQGRKF